MNRLDMVSPHPAPVSLSSNTPTHPPLRTRRDQRYRGRGSIYSLREVRRNILALAVSPSRLPGPAHAFFVNRLVCMTPRCLAAKHNLGLPMRSCCRKRPKERQGGCARARLTFGPNQNTATPDGQRLSSFQQRRRTRNSILTFHTTLKTNNT